MDEGVSPTLRLWQLAEFLRERREELNWTMDEAAKHLRANSKKSWSRSKVQRIEHRLYAPKPAEVEQIAAAYELTEAEAAELLEMSKGARQKGWWQSSALPSGTFTMVGLERTAETIREFHNMLVPGLLQTPAYVRALITSMTPFTAPEIQEARIAARLTRQHILRSESPTQLHVIIAESVLCWPVGGKQVMREQIDYLIELAESNHIVLQVVPFSVGVTLGMEGAFTIVSLPQLENDVGFVEGMMGGVYLEQRDRVRDCLMRFTTLSEQALSLTDSVKLLQQYVSKYNTELRRNRETWHQRV